MISKDDLIRRMKERENANGNPYNLTPEQLADVEITKAQVAEHLKHVDFSKHNQDNPTEIEKIAKRAYEFSHILGNRKSRNEY
jgi:hypothetical protein